MQSLPIVHDAQAPKRNRLLDQIQIAAPCPAKWDDMRGDDAKRFCNSCQKNVFNFAGMSTFEAEKLIFETEGNLCVRLFRRQDGTVITTDCPVGLAEKAWRQARTTFLASLSLVVMLFTGALVAVFGATRAARVVEPIETVLEVVEQKVRPIQPLAGAPMAIDRMELGEVAIPEPVR